MVPTPHHFLLLLVTCSVDAFLSPIHRPPIVIHPASQHDVLSKPYYDVKRQGTVSLNLFGDIFKKLRGDKDRDSEASDKSDAPAEDDGTAEAASGKSFFVQSTDEETHDAAETKQAEQQEETPESRAEKLRAQAARIRLEAEKGQVELTLEKISKLDEKLKKMKSKDGANEKEQRELEDALSLLKSQLVTNENGEITFVPSKPVALSVSPNVAKKSDKDEILASSSVPLDQKLNTEQKMPDLDLSDEELKQITQKFEQAPEFLKVMVARIAGFGVDEATTDKFNATSVILQLYRDEQQIELQTAFMKTNTSDAREMLERAYAMSKDMEPQISQLELDEKVEQLGNLPTFVKKAITGSTNDTKIAIDLLTDEYGKKDKDKNSKGRSLFNIFGNDMADDKIGNDGERMDKGGGTFGRMFSEDESTGVKTPRDDLGLLMESTFPASSRKEGQTPSEREVNAFVSNVLEPSKAFFPEEKPLSVPGGWIIRGKNQCKNGDELIEKLDQRIANVASLRDNVSFFLIKDPYPPSQDEFIQDPLNWPQVIFVTGSDVARDPRPVIGTLISSVGIATTWYASVYPFLTNTKLFDRAEEAMNLADAGMPVDLSWLSEECIPLFFSFMTLQLLHEVAHALIAKTKNFEITVPTLIPSIISGITGSITSLKSSPKNKSDLLLFSVAGPLTGIIASILLELYGLSLTASADIQSLQTFPGLPLALLRQSSLGGGLVDLVLGNGVLNVPASLEGANMLASTIIPLHPLAIAGFVSLMVNALALVPVGRTDGGRISMSLFGRSGSQGLTLLTLATLFIIGFSGSDLLLFYFGFLVLAQLELEIPLRNEIDDAGIPEVALASLAGFLTILTLVPM